MDLNPTIPAFDMNQRFTLPYAVEVALAARRRANRRAVSRVKKHLIRRHLQCDIGLPHRLTDLDQAFSAQGVSHLPHGRPADAVLLSET
jgi:hypothetical protein